MQSNNGDSLKVKSVSQRSSVSKFLFVRNIQEDRDDQIHIGGNRMEKSVKSLNNDLEYSQISILQISKINSSFPLVFQRD